MSIAKNPNATTALPILPTVLPDLLVPAVAVADIIRTSHSSAPSAPLILLATPANRNELSNQAWYLLYCPAVFTLTSILLQLPNKCPACACRSS